MAIRFERKSPTVVVAFFKKVRRDVHGRAMQATEAARAIKESGGWRVDRTAAVGGAWLPWEPITNESFRTLAEAKRRIVAYAESPAHGDMRRRSRRGTRPQAKQWILRRDGKEVAPPRTSTPTTAR